MSNPTSTPTQTWPELAIGLYDRLTGRGAEISYTFDRMELGVPASTSQDAPKAMWFVNGTLRISAVDQQGS